MWGYAPQTCAEGQERLGYGLWGCRITHIRTLLLVLIRQDIPEHVDGGIGLDGNSSLHALLVDIADQVLGAGLGGCGVVGGTGGGGGGNGGFVVEAVKITAGVFEVLDPFVGLYGD